MTSVVMLTDGRAECAVAPELGGSLLSWRVGGLDLLRPADNGATSPLDLASFPLVPFANRIGHGHFLFDGVEALPGPHPVAAPHALHGHGWERTWTMKAHTRQSVTLRYERPADRAWPWAYRCEQQIMLDGRDLRTAIRIENADARPMPAGAGIHPYFPRVKDSRVDAAATRHWRNDVTGLAVVLVDESPFAESGERRVDDLVGFDHFFPASDAVHIVQPSGSVVIPLTDAAGFHLYVPAGADHFCVEPVSHPPDVLGRGDRAAMAVLAPGQARTWQFPMRWSPA